jgi:hypothetical protein
MVAKQPKATKTTGKNKAKPGMHRMPDGTMMRNSDMKKAKKK